MGIKRKQSDLEFSLEYFLEKFSDPSTTFLALSEFNEHAAETTTSANLVASLFATAPHFTIVPLLTTTAHRKSSETFTLPFPRPFPPLSTASRRSSHHLTLRLSPSDDLLSSLIEHDRLSSQTRSQPSPNDRRNEFHRRHVALLLDRLASAVLAVAPPSSQFSRRVQRSNFDDQTHFSRIHLRKRRVHSTNSSTKRNFPRDFLGSRQRSGGYDRIRARKSHSNEFSRENRSNSTVQRSKFKGDRSTLRKRRRMEFVFLTLVFGRIRM